VPRSTKKLHEDNEYALYTVTLFRKVADNFRNNAREKGFQASLFTQEDLLKLSCVFTSMLELFLELSEDSQMCISFLLRFLNAQVLWCSLFTLFLMDFSCMLLVAQIREFEYSPEAQESRKQELEKLMQDQESKRSSLLQWCYASYGEVHLTF
ncbi:hypothetical protein B296_00058797, partial [Ensete ventricosum]